MQSHDKQFLNRRRFLTHTVAGGAALGMGLLGFPALAASRKMATIGYIPILDHLILGVSHAKDGSVFNKFQVEPRLFKSWRAIAGALEAGVIDGAFLLSNFAMDLFNRGLPLQAVLVGHRHGSGITVRLDSEIKGPEDLAGKTIAIPAKVSTHTALLDAYLRTAGLSLKHVTTRQIAPSYMVEAMMRKGIDAFIVAEPFCAKAEQEKVGRILAFSKEILPHHICCVLVLRKELLASQSEGLQAWVRSLVRSGQWIDQKKRGGEAGSVAQIATHYMPHTERLILDALEHPDDRIVYSDLNPRQADFQAIVDISLPSGIIQPVDLGRFVSDNLYKNVAV